MQDQTLLTRKKMSILHRLIHIFGVIALSYIILVLIMLLIVRPFFIQAFFVPSGSMRPTIHLNDHILVNKFLYRFAEPKFKEIVVFKKPNQAGRFSVMRIIGLPGDTIQVKYGAVVRNGTRLSEPYTLEPDSIYYNFGPYKIPEGKYFVLGDNRNDCIDSHTWGPLERGRILGKVWYIFKPAIHRGAIH